LIELILDYILKGFIDFIKYKKIFKSLIFAKLFKFNIMILEEEI